MQSNNYLNSLTGLRGLAALIVTISHTYLYSSINTMSVGNLGDFSVAVFFSLSGFLMGYIYAGKDFDNSAVQGYIISRTSRIAPAYLAIVLISFILFSFIDPSFPIQIDTSNLMRHLLFSGNQSVLWSIPPEIQFYSLFLALWYSIDSYKKQKSSLYLILFALLCGVMLIFSSKMPGTFVGSKIEYFMLGVLAGIFRKRLPASLLEKNILIIQFIILAGFSYFISELTNNYQAVNEFWSNQHYALLSSIIVYTLSFQTKLTAFLFNNKAMQNLGIWSFSLYLTHSITIHYFSKLIPIDSLLKEIAAILIAILISYCFYRVVEVKGIKASRLILLSAVKPSTRPKESS